MESILISIFFPFFWYVLILLLYLSLYFFSIKFSIFEIPFKILSLFNDLLNLYLVILIILLLFNCKLPSVKFFPVSFLLLNISLNLFVPKYIFLFLLSTIFSWFKFKIFSVLIIWWISSWLFSSLLSAIFLSILRPFSAFSKLLSNFKFL